MRNAGSGAWWTTGPPLQAGRPGRCACAEAVARRWPRRPTGRQGRRPAAAAGRSRSWPASTASTRHRCCRPSATFYRLAGQLSAGRHTFGSARTRRSLAQRPEGPFGTVTAVRPGEWMQIDSTPLDVRVVLDNGLVDRVELTWIIDLATRTIPAAVLRPATKAVDASAAAGPRDDPGADAAGLAGRAAHVPVGAAAPAADAR